MPDDFKEGKISSLIQMLLLLSEEEMDLLPPELQLLVEKLNNAENTDESINDLLVKMGYNKDLMPDDEMKYISQKIRDAIQEGKL